MKLFFYILIIFSAFNVNAQEKLNLIEILTDRIDLSDYSTNSNINHSTKSKLGISENFTKKTIKLGSEIIYSFNDIEGNRLLSSQLMQSGNVIKTNHIKISESEIINIIGNNLGVVITKNDGEECFGFELLNTELELKEYYPFFEGGFQNSKVGTSTATTILIAQELDNYSAKMILIDNKKLELKNKIERTFINQIISDIAVVEDDSFILLLNDVNKVNTTIIFFDSNFTENNKIETNLRVYGNLLNYNKSNNLLLTQYSNNLHIYNTISKLLVSKINISKICGEDYFSEMFLESSITKDGVLLLLFKPYKGKHTSEKTPYIFGFDINTNNLLFKKSLIDINADSFLMTHKTENKFIIVHNKDLTAYEF